MKDDSRNIVKYLNQALSKADLDDGMLRADNDIDAVRTWLSEFCDTVNTLVSYRQTALRFLMWLGSRGISLSTIKREDIQAYSIFLSDPQPRESWCGPAVSHRAPSWKPFVSGLSQSSIRLNLQILSNMCDYLLRAGYLKSNPFKLIRRKHYKSDKLLDKYLTHKEWQYIMQYIETLPRVKKQQLLRYQRIKWIFSLLYFSACRRHEIVRAHMSDFIKKKGLWWLRVTGKGNKPGLIPVTNALLVELKAYRRVLNLPDYPSVYESHIPLVNSLRSDTGINDSMLYKIVKDTCKRVADNIFDIDPNSASVIEQVSTHWLRHTSATHQVDSGIDIRVVQKNMRHASINTTMIYQHLDDIERHIETNNKFNK